MAVSNPKINSLTIKLFLRHVAQFPWLAWPLLAFVVVSFVGGAFALPYITSQVLDRLSRGQFNVNNLWGDFGGLVVTYGIITFAVGVVTWRVAVWLVWTLELRVTRNLSQEIFDHLIRMSPAFHANRFAGSLVSQANKLTGSYIRMMDATVFSLLTLIISIVVIVIILAPRAPLYVAFLIVLSVFYIAGTVLFSRPVRAAAAKESNLQSRQTGYLADSVANVSAVKTFSASRFESLRYLKAGNEVRDAGNTHMWATIKRETFASMVTSTVDVLAITMAVIGIGVLKGDVGTIFLMVTYTAVLSQQLWNFQGILRQFNRAFGDASDMVDILQIKPEIADAAKPEKLRVTAGAIELDDVTFAHPEADETLFTNFNLSIKAGEKIGLVGHSGSGKTTLTKLLLRFSDIDSGAITIDGQSITAISQNDLHRVVSYVPQEPLLFHRTLEENIAYGNPKASHAEIVRAAKNAHASEFIDKLPQGYNTLVGERGVKLSGGQRQRVVIARAMLKNAPILMLDEATSALDSESERLIQDALWKLMEDRTAIVIAHRLSTVQHMDRIVVLQDGVIAEQGTHAQLLGKGGVYASLWSHQSGGFMEDAN